MNHLNRTIKKKVIVIYIQQLKIKKNINNKLNKVKIINKFVHKKKDKVNVHLSENIKKLRFFPEALFI